MSNFSKLSEQKRMNDRSEKNDIRNKVERLPLNPVRELCEKSTESVRPGSYRPAVESL